MSVSYYIIAESLPWVDTTSPERQAAIKELLESHPTTPYMSDEEYERLNDLENIREAARKMHEAAESIRDASARMAALATLPPIPPPVEWPSELDEEEEECEGNAILHDFWGEYQHLYGRLSKSGQYKMSDSDDSERWWIHAGRVFFAVIFTEVYHAQTPMGQLFEVFDRDVAIYDSLALLEQWFAEDYPEFCKEAAAC